MTRQFVLIAAYHTTGTLLKGFPGSNKYEGPYNNDFPSPAASKAYTQVLQFIDAHKDWSHYRELDTDNLPLIIVVQEKHDSDFGKIFSYLVWREEAPQGKKSIINSYGINRTYQWRSRAIPIKRGESIQSALAKYKKKQDISRKRAIATGNLNAYNRDPNYF